MDPITLAVGGLAYAVPKIAEWLGGSKAAEAAQAVADVAVKVAGVSDIPAAVHALNGDSEKLASFEQEMKKLELEFDRLYLSDKNNARDMYKTEHTTADAIAQRVMQWNLVWLLVVLAAQCCAMWFLRDNPDILAAVSATCGFIINGLLAERREVTGFYFGSSLGSRIKDK